MICVNNGKWINAHFHESADKTEILLPQYLMVPSGYLDAQQYLFINTLWLVYTASINAHFNGNSLRIYVYVREYLLLFGKKLQLIGREGSEEKTTGNIKHWKNLQDNIKVVLKARPRGESNVVIIIHFHFFGQ